MLTEAKCHAALPPHGFLRRYVDYARRSTDAHLSYHIMNGLGILTQIVPSQVHLRFGAEPIYANIYGLLVGQSSLSRKSASLRMAREIIREGKGRLMEMPASKEALIQLLIETPRQLLLYPEFGAFLSAAENSHQTPMKTMLNDAFDCSPLSNVTVGNKRAGGKLAHIENPRLSLIGACDPNYLSRHSEMVDWESGFFARFMCFYAQRERFYTSPPDLRTERDALISDFNVLRERAEKCPTTSYCRGRSFTADAIWQPWAASIEKRTTLVKFKPAMARATTLALKIAIILSCDFGKALEEESWEISAQAMQSAINITELNIESASYISQFIAPDRDMMFRNRVLLSVGTTPTLRSKVLSDSDLLKGKFDQVIATLIDERKIEVIGSSVTSSEASYRLTDSYQADLLSQKQLNPAVEDTNLIPRGIGQDLDNAVQVPMTPDHSTIETEQHPASSLPVVKQRRSRFDFL